MNTLKKGDMNYRMNGKRFPIKEIKSQWSISTIKIFLENTNENNAVELMYNKEYLQNLMQNLISDHRKMFINLKPDDSDESVKKYFVAINDIKDWINAL